MRKRRKRERSPNICHRCGKYYRIAVPPYQRGNCPICACD